MIMPTLPTQVVEIYTGDLTSILAQITEALTHDKRYDLTAISMFSAPGQVPGPGLACVCIWTK
jgi:hypothetical protein